jgi:hypothetical protein
MVSTSDSQYTPSLPPSAPAIASPLEEAILSPAVSDVERHSADLSPTFSPDSSQPPLPGPRHSGQVEDQNREPLNIHRHLPSLSDMFDGQGLPGGMRPSTEPNNGYRFPGPHVVANPSPPLGHLNGDGRAAPPANGQPYGGNQSSHQSFGHPRPPVDGPLPIHALLASKPEPTFHNHQPPQSHHGSHYHGDPNPRPTHQMSNGATGLPMINGASSTWIPSAQKSRVLLTSDQGYHHHPPPPAHSHHHAPMNHINQSFCPQPQVNGPPLPPNGVPKQGKQHANFDGMSALLKAGEIVDRRAQ